ncbi:two-component system response regulator [Thiohalocapsa marina]|uniref:Two-component system response regulator n=1 Tax=Thiohalocapsa marina TaxID=424902 RepID=A0A5M8FSW7_9GAMM|nr:two-component system response regulator [Thiohalocapsa marina]KAA6186222.1 two-component system response regulator [Thiohalocapsa marina]
MTTQTPSSADNGARHTILIVDDTPQNLTVLGELLQPLYRVRVANSGERALRVVANQPQPDLILLDVMMPGMDGHEVLRRLRADPATQNIPVIFITAMEGSENEEYGLKLGAVDYITKPINPAIVLARVKAQLELKDARDRLANENEWLEAEVARRMQDNLLIQDLSIRALANLAEARDNETGQHILRTQTYVEILGRHLAEHPRFKQALAGQRLERIVKAAPLHDVGKVGIPDAILLKPGRLTPEEFAIMRTHAAIGAEAIERAMQISVSATNIDEADQVPDAFAFLQVASEIARSHHEKWDGSGYPAGLSGDDIPVSGRLMALADVFDALMNKRIYKPAMGLEETTRIILEGRGTHFDPAVVDAFTACSEQFAEVAARHPDPDPDPTPTQDSTADSTADSQAA